jgi:hypothetical protein
MRAFFTRLAERLFEPWIDESDLAENPYRAGEGPSAVSDRAHCRGDRPRGFAHPQAVGSGWTGPFLRRFLSATLASALAHAALLLLLAQMFYEERRIVPPPFIVSTFHSIEEEAVLVEPELTPAEVSEDPDDSPLAATMESIASLIDDDALLATVAEQTVLDAPIDLPSLLPETSGAELNEVVVHTGTVGVEVREVEGAVDRLTEEIITQLEDHKLLVVWLMDASISLVPDRQDVAERLTRIYGEIEGLGGVKEDDALHSAVVAFGQRTREMAAPTDDTSAIVAAIRQVPTDESGVENVFTAVNECVVRYQRARTSEHRRMLIIVWTDESGNDDARLEDAVRFCRNNVVPVYVVGPSSMFGKQQGTMSYRHSDGKVYQLPVDRGPDTVREERPHLPYWFDGPQYDSLLSGLGPFALTRLAHETGGAYFIKDHAADRSPFDVEQMRRYHPDYESPELYLRHAQASPLRRAVLTAVDVTRQRKFKATPRLTFAPTGKTFFNELREAQETAAYDIGVAQQALAAFGKNLEHAYAKETSPRWRAWYDLTYGRLLAMSVRCAEYNWACAVMKGKGADFVDNKSNRWHFNPDAELHFGSASQRMAKEARRLLMRCVEQNAGTPWALLAQRELKDPFGFRIDEAYVAPPPPPPRPKAQPAAPPPPPPASNARRSEQPRKLNKPAEAALPKL